MVCGWEPWWHCLCIPVWRLPAVLTGPPEIAGVPMAPDVPFFSWPVKKVLSCRTVGFGTVHRYIEAFVLAAGGAG